MSFIRFIYRNMGEGYFHKQKSFKDSFITQFTPAQVTGHKTGNLEVTAKLAVDQQVGVCLFVAAQLVLSSSRQLILEHLRAFTDIHHRTGMNRFCRSGSATKALEGKWGVLGGQCKAGSRVLGLICYWLELPKCYSSVKQTLSDDPWWNKLCTLFHVDRNFINIVE